MSKPEHDERLLELFAEIAAGKIKPADEVWDEMEFESLGAEMAHYERWTGSFGPEISLTGYCDTTQSFCLSISGFCVSRAPFCMGR